jgi:hypothetical protein
MSTPETPVPATAATAVASGQSVLTKVQRHIDLLKGKNSKLAEENAKLKAALASAKVAGSRIRRIPKKDAAAAAAAPASA